MNLVGKIFVVLIFVMSLVFATLSIMVYATHKNWKDEILRTPAEVRGGQTVGWKERLNQAHAENERLKGEIATVTTQLNAEKAAKIQALSKSEAVIQALSTQRDAAQQQLQAKDTELAANTETLRVTQNNLTNLTTEVKKLRDDIAVANRETDEQIKKATAVTDKLSIADGQLAVLKERNDQLVQDVAKARMLLGKTGMKLEDPLEGTLPVAGIITSVARSQVEVSVGVDDGVRVGQELDVYRGDKYVGRVRVIEASPDKAVATILPEYQQFPIQRGDNVSTRLKA